MKKYNLIPILAFIFTLWSCEDSLKPGIEDSPEGVYVKYRVDNDMPLTRGIAANEFETELSRAHILFFTESGDYIGHSVSNVSDATKLGIEIPENVVEDTPYTMLALGNADSYVPEGSASVSDFLDSFSGTYQDALNITAYCAANITSRSKSVLPMWGRYVDSEGESLTISFYKDGTAMRVKEDSPTGEFLFSRALCRVDIHNLVGHVLDITHARIANNRTSGLYFNDGVNVGEIAEFKGNCSSISDVEKSNIYMPITTPMQEGQSSTQRLESSLYTFPNIVNTTMQNDKVTTCLIIAGYYTDPATGIKDTKLTFYRFNLANVGESQALQRNYAYKATIKGVKRRGADSEGSAYNDAIPIFEYQVDEEWDTTGDNVVSDENGNFLIVNRTHFTFAGDASEADFVELRVSTNPALSWTIEPVFMDNAENDKFIYDKISDSAVQLGPKEINETDYVRYGYYKIIAKDNAGEMAKPLEITIYLMQLSTNNNIKMLSVNGNTGEFDVNIPKQGGSIVYKVVTGSSNNRWVAVDTHNDLEGWDKYVNWTKQGGNKGDLEISIPANISGVTREAWLTVRLDPEDENVRPVVLHLIQENSDQLYKLSPAVDGTVSINAFSIRTSDIPNGVPAGCSRSYTVTLTDKENYLFNIETSFNQGRDVRLSVGNHHENDASFTSVYDTFSQNESQFKNLPSGTTFYINPFRMGPGDGTIRGTVTITVFHKDHPDEPEYQVKEPINFEILSGDYELNDVIIGNILVPDRNVGHQPRIQYDYSSGEMTPTNDPFLAKNYSELDNLYIIRGGIEVNEKDETYNDNDYRYRGMALSTFQSQTREYWDDRHKDENQIFSPFYLSKDVEKWDIPTQEQFESIATRLTFSKNRAFIISDVKKKVGNKSVPVVCWLHQGYGVCHGFGETGKKNKPYHMVYTIQINNMVNAIAWQTYASVNYNISNTAYNTSGGTENALNMQCRLVRVLTDEELASYKTNYLGY